MFTTNQRVRCVMLAMALVLWAMPGAGSFWAKESAAGGLWISADRIVGFVPFTVYVYGKMRGVPGGDLELCRSEVAWITDSSSRLAGAGGQSPSGVMGKQIADHPACSKGQTIRTPDGYQYRHDMQFDRPGIYHVRLMMIDTEGHRRMSNTLRISAF